MDLSTNWAGDEGAKAIAGALEVNSVLTDLNLRFNSIGDEGAKSIASALHVSVLTELNIYRNNIGEDGISAIAQAISEATSLVLRKLIVPDGAEEHWPLKAACGGKGVKLV